MQGLLIAFGLSSVPLCHSEVPEIQFMACDACQGVHISHIGSLSSFSGAFRMLPY
jgi:hypothetical protein